METRKGEVSTGLARYWNIIKNGLFIFGLRNRLAIIGIDINPYYWVQEETTKCSEPILKNDNASNYIIRDLNIDEIKALTSHHGVFRAEMIKGMENGQLCIGLENNGEIACYSFVELNYFDFKGRLFKLETNEAYLLNMWTFHNYRGRNLAPYLRYQIYRMLEGRGVNIKYSITQYFNKSSIKFKKKLNSKHHYLYLSIVLFKKVKWNFVLKKY